jgi:hypothetical protein
MLQRPDQVEPGSRSCGLNHNIQRFERWDRPIHVFLWTCNCLTHNLSSMVHEATSLYLVTKDEKKHCRLPTELLVGKTTTEYVLSEYSGNTISYIAT